MGSLNEMIKKGRSISLGDAIISLFLIGMCVMLSKIIFITAGVSLIDYNRYELTYNLMGGLIGLSLSGLIIIGHRNEMIKKYSQGSI